MVNGLAKLICDPLKPSGEEPDEAPLGLDPSLSDHLCPHCGAQCLDLGQEAADEFTRASRWYQCSSPSCKFQFKIITAPARKQEPKESIAAWKQRQSLR